MEARRIKVLRKFLHLLTSSKALLFAADNEFLLLGVPCNADGLDVAVLVFDPPRALTTVVRGFVLVKMGAEVSAIVDTTDEFP